MSFYKGIIMTESSGFSMSIDTWCDIPTDTATFRMYDTGSAQVRLISYGDISALKKNTLAPLVRIHSSCIASEIFKAKDCDCADQLEQSLELIANEKQGIVFHLEQEGRGHGLAKKIKAVQAGQVLSLDTAQAFIHLGFEQDIRTYEDPVSLLKQLGIFRVRLISNNYRKKEYLEMNGITVIEQVAMTPIIRNENREYLITKNEKLAHTIPLSV